MSTENVDLTDPCEHVATAPIRHVQRPPKGCDRTATAHFHATQHPIVSSAEVGETWCWCYVDDRLLG